MKPDTIYCADACEVLAGFPAVSVDLVFADPPFNIGYVYDEYHDDRPDAEYVAWSKAWMAACRHVLKPSGSFYIAIGDEFAADIRVIGRQLGLHWRNWIVWRYTFGQNMKDKFCRAHTHILYFTKSRVGGTFNDHRLRFPSARHTEYQDLRANPAGRLPDDVWDEFPRVCGTFKERAGFHGCQMPEMLLQRIIMASSNPGDVVLDPFIGSGTTAVAAKRLGRRYIGIDLSPEYVAHVERRLAGVQDETSRPACPGHWPEFHKEQLAQLYRETKVTLPNLLPNAVALGVIATGLRARTGAAYSVDELRAELKRMATGAQLPKLPNDRQFAARNHVTSTGKRYQRKIHRLRPRQTSDTAVQAG